MIPVFRPNYDEREFQAVREVLASGWIGLGPKTKEFEDRFAEYIGVKYAVGVNSCTAALHLAMQVMDVKGGEVITTPITFVSTNHAILYCGATPVFCDVEPDTMNIDAGKIEALVTPRTKAIVCVHYGGYPCDMERILDIARRHNLKVIEDAAHACGGEWQGRKLGGIGDIGCYSFHAVKNLATGEGGMVTTNDSEIRDHLMRLRWLGITKDTWSREAPGKGYSWAYDVPEVGYKYHLSDVAAVLGLVQLKKLDESNARRRALTLRYNAALAGTGDIQTPVQKEYQTLPAHHNYVIRTGRRDALNEHLKSLEISTGMHYIPNNFYQMYKNCAGPTPVAHAEWTKLLTLPLYPGLTDAQQDSIIQGVKDFYHGQ